jgi:hypothetical protein
VFEVPRFVFEVPRFRLRRSRLEAGEVESNAEP